MAGMCVTAVQMLNLCCSLAHGHTASMIGIVLPKQVRNRARRLLYILQDRGIWTWLTDRQLSPVVATPRMSAYKMSVNSGDCPEASAVVQQEIPTL